MISKDEARAARLQVDADTAAGCATPHETLVAAAGDRTVEPLLDGRGNPLTVDSPDGLRPLTIAEAEAGDEWAREAAMGAPADREVASDDPAAIQARIDALQPPGTDDIEPA